MGRRDVVARVKSKKSFGGALRGRKGISPVVSTIIISAILLIILVIASFVSTNILEMQVTNSEFEQAKSSMLALNQVIQDVALRPGSGSYLQFNQRSGGIGVYDNQERLKVYTSETELVEEKLTLRPNENGSYSDWSAFGPGVYHWDRTGDSNDNTGVEIVGNTTSRETVKLANATYSPDWSILSVTGYLRAKANGSLQGFSPKNFSLLGSTSLLEGGVDNLTLNDQNYMRFKSYNTNIITNLVKNGNISNGTNNWNYDEYDKDDKINYGVTGESFTSPSSSLYIQIIDDSNGQGYNGYGSFNQTVPVEGSPVSARFYFNYSIKCNASDPRDINSENVTIMVNLTLPNGTTITIYNNSTTFTSARTLNWSYIECNLSSIVTQSGNYTLALIASFSTGKSSQPIITVYLDDIGLEIVRSFGTCGVEFIGSADLGNWKNLTWTIDSAWNISNVNTTIQVYRYPSGYPTSGDGYYFYNNSNANEDRTITGYTDNPSQFLNSTTGEWRINITGVKETTQTFELKVDLIKFEIFYEGDVKAVLIFRTHGNDYQSQEFAISHTSFEDYSNTSTKNPSTGSAWTWDEINDLEIGASATTLGPYEKLQISEFWVEIEYTKTQLGTLCDYPSLVSLIYRGGSRTATTSMVLAGKDSPWVDMSDQLGYVRVEVGDGSRIILDYNRVRVVTNSIVLVGEDKYNFTEVSLIRLYTEPGSLGGSGTINLKIQNTGTNIVTRVYDKSNCTLYIQVGNKDPVSMPLISEEGIKTAIIFTEIKIKISMG